MDEEGLSEAFHVALYMRSRGVYVSTEEIVEALRIHRAAKILIGREYPLRKVLEAVFAKKPWHEILLRDALSGRVRETSSKEPDISVETATPPLVKDGWVKEGSSFPTWDELRRTSIGKLRRKGVTDRIVLEKLRIARLVNQLEKYMLTGDKAYLELLHSELSSLRRRLLHQQRESPLANLSYYRVYSSLEKLSSDPSNPYALMTLAEEFGGSFAINAVRYALVTGRKFLAEKIALRTLRLNGKKRDRGLKTPSSRKGRKRGRLDARRTLYNSIRGHPERIVYRSKENEPGVVLVIDKSDSMRKHAESVLKIASTYHDIVDKILLFDEDVQIISVKTSMSRAYLIDQLLSKGFSGYTNIYRALKKALFEARKKRETIVIVSDFQQTVGEKPFMDLLGKIALNRIPLVIYTTPVMTCLIRKAISHGRIILRGLA